MARSILLELDELRPAEVDAIASATKGLVIEDQHHQYLLEIILAASVSEISTGLLVNISDSWTSTELYAQRMEEAVAQIQHVGPLLVSEIRSRRGRSR